MVLVWTIAGGPFRHDKRSVPMNLTRNALHPRRFVDASKMTIGHVFMIAAFDVLPTIQKRDAACATSPREELAFTSPVMKNLLRPARLRPRRSTPAPWRCPSRSSEPPLHASRRL